MRDFGGCGLVGSHLLFLHLNNGIFILKCKILFLNALRELDLLEMYTPLNFLSQEQKDIRKKQAIEILAKLRAKRNTFIN